MKQEAGYSDGSSEVVTNALTVHKTTGYGSNDVEQDTGHGTITKHEVLVFLSRKE